MEPMPDRTQGTRAYVWVVCACTTLLAAFAFHATNVTEFQSSASFQVRYDATTAIEKSHINNWVIAKLQEETTQEALDALLAELDPDLANPQLQSFQEENLREALSVKSRPGTKSSTLDFLLVLRGTGAQGEVQLVNALTARVAANLGSTQYLSSAQESIERAVNNFTRYQESLFLDYEQHLDLSRSQLSKSNERLSLATQRIESAMTDNAGSGGFVGPASSSQGKLEKLESQKRQLLAASHTTIYHPEVTKLQLEIEALQRPSANHTRFASHGESTSTSMGKDSKHVTNRFMENRGDSPARAQLDHVLGNTLMDLQAIDLTPPQVQLDGFRDTLTRHRSNAPTVVGRIKGIAMDRLENNHYLSVNELTLAQRSKPVNGSPSTKKFFWICMLAGAFATTVAVNYQTGSRIKRFRSLEQLQSKLGIPVLGVVKSRIPDQTEIPFRARLAGKAVSTCEWALLAVFIVLLLASVINSEIISALIQNPMEAVTRTFWMLSPRGV